MRIISGTARGRKLVAPEGELTRPTSDMVKEAMFSILQFRLAGQRVLDLFAGSGQLGLEALSRGAQSAVFVDCRSACASVIRGNIAAAGFEDNSRVVCSDFVPFLRSCRVGEFGIILLDPPYGGELLNSALTHIVESGILSPDGGLIMCESAREDLIKLNAPQYEIIKEYFYGKKKLTLIGRNG